MDGFVGVSAQFTQGNISFTDSAFDLAFETWLASEFEESPLPGLAWYAGRLRAGPGYLVRMSLSLLVNRNLYSVSL